MRNTVCVQVKTCADQAGFYASWQESHVWLAAPSAPSSQTLCRYSRLILTTQNQKKGVVLHHTVCFTQARNSLRKRKLYVEDPDSVYVGSTSKFSPYRSCIYFCFSSWLICLDIVFVSVLEFG